MMSSQDVAELYAALMECCRRCGGSNSNSNSNGYPFNSETLTTLRVRCIEFMQAHFSGSHEAGVCIVTMACARLVGYVYTATLVVHR